MNIPTPHLRRLSPRAMVWLSLGLLSLLLCLPVHQHHEQAWQQRLQAQSRNAEMQARLHQAGPDMQRRSADQALLDKLRARGLATDTLPLEAIPRLPPLRERWHLPGMQYAFSPPQPLDPQPGAWTFYTSPLHLQLWLLHEGDLLNVLEELRRLPQALVIVRHCDLTRLPPAATPPSSGLLAQLKADCLLDWITLHRAPAR